MSAEGQRADVVVVGAGIAGLHTALALAEAGHAVAVVAADVPQDTVSAVAGGLWSPFRAGPPDAVARWARAGYDAYLGLVDAEPEAAVRRVDVVLVVEDDTVPHRWEASAPPGAGRAAAARERPPGVAAARLMTVPIVDTARHLGWLERRLDAVGTRIARSRLGSLDEAFAVAPVVVACPGLAARELLGDAEVVAVRGVVVEVAFAGSTALPAILDERGPQPTYVLPRLDGTVLLGGSADAGDERRAPGRGEVADVVARCGRLVPELARAPVLRARAGLRPGRPAVRVEELPHPRGRLVVNYGHGGSGWTLAAGCAQDVAALVGADGRR